jgi:hypothetical protein
MSSSSLASSETTATTSNKNIDIATAIASAWLLAGSLDILAAIVHAGLHGVPPILVLKAVASGALGAAAFHGGIGTALTGLGLHFSIMLIIVLCSWQFIQRFRWLAIKRWRAGVALGIGVYLVMNLAVLPLSAIAYTPSYSWSSLLVGLGIHIVCVGLPIAWILQRRAARIKNQAVINP